MQRTEKSQEFDARAKKVLPGGDTRTSTYYGPYPAYMSRGQGCRLYDEDGNEYIDFLNNYTSLIHGHAHPAVTQAIAEQAANGTVLGSPADVTVRHAEMITSRLKSVEQVRYGNSGTEATLFAIRAARAYTGKDIIVKMDGGYHGSHDLAEVSSNPDISRKHLPVGHVDTLGVPDTVLKDVLVVPFNDLDAIEGVLKANQGKVAGVILEPFMGSGGGVAPLPGYLKGVRALTEKYGALMILDEIITFRLSMGGFQEVEGVTPDLTALGKIIGGGLPIGAFGGRKEIMARFDPASPQAMVHSGTFNGNNITMAAGLAAMEHYQRPEVDRINALGERMLKGFDAALKNAGLKGHCSGRGSVLVIHWSDKPLTNSREVYMANGGAIEVVKLLHLEMMNRGIFAASRGQFAISTPMTEKEVDQAVTALEGALDTIKPFIKEKAPQLVG
jgi:glutamate-1-semialdehyde 2,1-aminomutase